MDRFDEVMDRLRAGDPQAADLVFRRYARRLMGLAQDQFETWLRPRADVEELVQSVYQSFFHRFEAGRFALDDWAALWGLLTVITLRKCVNRREFLLAGRRDARRVEPSEALLDGLIDREPSPDEAAILAETVAQLLEGFEPPERAIVELSLAGWSTREIAQTLARSERTVRRVREYVRRRLEEAAALG
jgi:RNA polymerase sigma-70 factor (ECF subfamily)